MNRLSHPGVIPLSHQRLPFRAVSGAESSLTPPYHMKKLLSILAVLAAIFVFAPTKAEAGHQSRVIGKCQHCHSNIYSYYKPVRYSDGCVRYVWVPDYHDRCRASYSSSYRSHSYRPSYSYPSRSYSRPGFSIQFGYGGGGYCR